MNDASAWIFVICMGLGLLFLLVVVVLGIVRLIRGPGRSARRRAKDQRPGSRRDRD